MTDPVDKQQLRGFRRNLMRIMLTISFAAGALFGLLAASVGLPATLWAPALLLMSGVFWLLVR